MIRARLRMTIGAALLAGCAGRAPAAVPLPADPRACAVPMTAPTPEAQAVACAEEFIARNGYTDAEPDTARLATESIEWGSVEETLKRRRGSLESRAAGICGDATGYDHTIVFRYRSSQTGARAVTMTRHFDGLRMQHVDFILANVTAPRHGCRPLD